MKRAARFSIVRFLNRHLLVASLTLLAALTLMSPSASAQLSGPKSIPGDYATLAAAIADLNTQCVGAGGVTFSLAASQTAPAGGYVIGGAGSAILSGPNASSAAKPIVFNGGGNTISAATPQASGNLNDGIFKLVGADWVAISGFTMRENAANTITAAGTNNMTEWGVALLYVTPTDGAQNNTIQNNTIDLDRTYQNTFGIYSNSTHTAADVITSATASGAAGGNSSLKVYANNITDVNIGIVLVGPTAGADHNTGMDIGGVAAATGNTITNYGTSGTFSGYANVAGTVNGILVRNTKNFNISFNNIASSNGGTTSGTLLGIYVPSFTSAPTGTIANTINNNNISLRSGLASGAIQGIVNEGTTNSATTTLTINNNDFNTSGYTAAGSGAVTFISNTATTLNTNINGNTFTNMTVNTTGNLTFISNSVTHPAGAVTNVNNNSIVTAFSKTGSGGTVLFYNSNGSSPATASETNSGNNFSNVSFIVFATLNGWVSEDGVGSNGPTKIVTGNTFSNITGGSPTTILSVSHSSSATVSGNLISNVTGPGLVLGLLSSSGNQDFSGNTINNVSTNGGNPVTGIQISGGATQNLSRNKVYNLSGNIFAVTVTGIGINLTGSNTVTVSNNLVGNLTAPTSTSSNGVIGVNVQFSSPTAACNLFNNTVYLNNPGSGAGFGSSAISTFASSSPTTSTLNLRNNVIVNTSVQNGAGLTVAYRRSAGTAGTLANYANSSNNNLFYAGTPSATHLIYSDGTSTAQTIAAYRSAVFTAGTVFPRDSVSVSEAPPFLSTVGSSADFLHINPTVPTQIESGGAPIPGITDDFDGNARNANFPDIGADEFSGTIIDGFGPVIAYTPLTRTSSSTDRVLGTTITDPNGVAGGATAPRIYYRKNGGSYVSNQCAAPSGNVYPCTIDYSLISGVVLNDVIEYFVVAQDSVGNVGVTPAGGFSATDVNNVTSPPTTLSSYLIVQGLSGSINVGAGETYTSLTNNDAQGLFRAINNNTVTGNVTINITSDLTLETGAISLNQWIEDGAGGYTLLIQPSGAPRLISGSNPSVLINLDGADRVMFSGVAFGGQSLTIRNTSATTGSTFQLINDASNNNILSCIVEQGNGSTTILISTGVTTGNDNNAILNSIIRDRAGVAPLNGIVSLGTNSAISNGNITISNNQITNFNQAGIIASGTGNNNWTITNNDISQTADRSTQLLGMSFASLGTNVISGNQIHDLRTSVVAGGGRSTVGMSFGDTRNTTVSQNRIYSFPAVAGGTGRIVGIEFDGFNGAPSSIRLVNNMISVSPTVVTAQSLYGIFDFSFGTNTFTADHNSIYIGGMSGAAPSWGLARGTSAPDTFTARNNIVINNRTGGSVNHFAGGDQSANTGTFVSNYNFFAGTGTSAVNFMDYGTSATGTPVSFATWQTGPPASDTNSTAGTAASFVVTNIFVDALGLGDLHIMPTAAVGILGAGTPLGSVTTDFDNDPRPAASLDLGADELVQATGGLIPAGNFYNASANEGESLGGDVTITRVFYLNGKLVTGANKLTLGCPAFISGASSTNYVIGNLARTFCAGGSRNFDVGTVNGYSPVLVNVTDGTFPADLTVKAVQGPDPLIPSPQYALQRYWSLTATSITANLTFIYLDPEDIPVTANENAFVIFKDDGSLTMPGGLVNPGGNFATINGVTSFSNWTLAQPNAPTSAPATISGVVTTSDGQPLGGVTVNLTGGNLNGVARTITDANGQYRFDNVETDGFYVVKPELVNYSFSPETRAFTLLANKTDAAFSATATTQTENPLNFGDFFVRQQYLDFLGREPDQAGWLYWTGQLSSCLSESPALAGGPTPLDCIRQKRLDISAAFFMSDEFQQSGNYIYRLYRAALARQLTYAEFTDDHKKVIGGTDLESLRKQFADEFVQRPAFLERYQNATWAEGFVDSLLQTVGQDAQLDLSSQREQLIAKYNSAGDLNHARSAVLQAVAENSEFKTAVFNSSFVLMEYFGYLRRDLDQSGFEFWLNVLNNRDLGNYRGMVCSFLTSAEYQQRFGSVVSRSNGECAGR